MNDFTTMKTSEFTTLKSKVAALEAKNAALVKALEALNRAVCNPFLVFGKKTGKKQLLAAYQQSLDTLAKHDAEKGRDDD